MAAAPDHGPAEPKTIRPRSIGDEQLVAALAGDGCPLCAHVAEIGPRYLASLLGQHTTDPTAREEFLAGGGFCPRHVRGSLEADLAGDGDGVGAAIFLRSMATARARALAAAEGLRRRSRTREATRAAWACPACEQERVLAVTAAQRLVAHAALDGAWRDRVLGARWCLAHVGDLLVAADDEGRDIGRQLRRATLERLSALTERLDRLEHDSSHGRRDRLTPEVRASLSEVTDLLAGDASPGSG